MRIIRQWGWWTRIWNLGLGPLFLVVNGIYAFQGHTLNALVFGIMLGLYPVTVAIDISTARLKLQMAETQEYWANYRKNNGVPATIKAVESYYSNGKVK